MGAGTTGNTTAKVSLLQGTQLSHILERQSRQVAEAYVEANREGQAWLLRFCDDHDVAVQRRDAVTYAIDKDASLARARAEYEAARQLGLPAQWVEDLGTVFPSYGGALLADQAQFDPLDVLAALLAEVRREGGAVVSGRRMVGCATGDSLEVSLDDGSVVRCEHLVQATGIPVLDRGLYFAKLEPQRSYALAFDHPDPAPMPMMLSAGSPTRSIRDIPGEPGRHRLLVGGEGHAVGRSPSEKGSLDRLREWTARYYPEAAESHAWSAQDYASPDGLPFIERMPRGGGRIFVGTGYAKWGMTNAVAAGRAISADILGSPASWSLPISRRTIRPSGALGIARINAAVAMAMVSGLARAELHPLTRVPDQGGDVGRKDLRPTGAARVNGQACAVVALCTHLGGTLTWNDAENSWDCPLHGSRFTPQGDVLEGPATRPLRQATIDDVPTQAGDAAAPPDDS
jgi:glycine/D-amino acid oxidase-like deaminating enzyme/nitrite reductase/ring-hydroxylating ferredoxin subunit